MKKGGRKPLARNLMAGELYGAPPLLTVVGMYVLCRHFTGSRLRKIGFFSHFFQFILCVEVKHLLSALEISNGRQKRAFGGHQKAASKLT